MVYVIVVMLVIMKSNKARKTDTPMIGPVV